MLCLKNLGKVGNLDHVYHFIPQRLSLIIALQTIHGSSLQGNCLSEWLKPQSILKLVCIFPVSYTQSFNCHITSYYYLFVMFGPGTYNSTDILQGCNKTMLPRDCVTLSQKFLTWKQTQIIRQSAPLPC